VAEAHCKSFDGPTRSKRRVVQQDWIGPHILSIRRSFGLDLLGGYVELLLPVAARKALWPQPDGPLHSIAEHFNIDSSVVSILCFRKINSFNVIIAEYGHKDWC
jgi:hypothetical protein